MFFLINIFNFGTLELNLNIRGVVEFVSKKFHFFEILFADRRIVEDIFRAYPGLTRGKLANLYLLTRLWRGCRNLTHSFLRGSFFAPKLNI